MKFIMVVVRTWAAGAHPPQIISLYELLSVGDGRANSNDSNAIAWSSMHVDKVQRDNAKFLAELVALIARSPTNITAHHPLECEHLQDCNSTNLAHPAVDPNIDLDPEFQIVVDDEDCLGKTQAKDNDKDNDTDKNNDNHSKHLLTEQKREFKHQIAELQRKYEQQLLEHRRESEDKISACARAFKETTNAVAAIIMENSAKITDTKIAAIEAVFEKAMKISDTKLTALEMKLTRPQDRGLHSAGESGKESDDDPFALIQDMERIEPDDEEDAMHDSKRDLQITHKEFRAIHSYDEESRNQPNETIMNAFRKMDARAKVAGSHNSVVIGSNPPGCHFSEISSAACNQ